MAPPAHAPLPQPSAPPMPEADTRYTEPVTGHPPVMGYPTNPNHTHVQPPRSIPPPCPPPPQRLAYVSRRCTTASLIAVVVVGFMVFAIVRNLYQPKAPVVKLVGMSVSNFTISGTDLTANWGVNISVGNPRTRMKAKFGRVLTYVYYRYVLVSWSEEDPFEVDAEGNRNVSVSTSAEGKGQGLEVFVIDEMQVDRKSGEMSFDVTMGMLVEYRPRLSWMREQGFKVSCTGIRVEFGSGSGANMADGDRQCQVW